MHGTQKDRCRHKTRSGANISHRGVSMLLSLLVMGAGESDWIVTKAKLLVLY
jgi:hypothetical protein